MDSQISTTVGADGDGAVRLHGFVRLIVCAAMRKSGHVICGARHFDGIMRSAIYLLSDQSHVGWEQGFIDNKGQFLTREEAWEVANAAGQIRRRCGGDNGRLFSENLY